MSLKTCKKCQNELPLNQFNSYRNSPDGHFYYCKDCASAINKSYRKAHCTICGRVDYAKNMQFHQEDGFAPTLYCLHCIDLLFNRKTCSICGLSKPHSEFYTSRISPDGLFDECKVCCKASDDKIIRSALRMKRDTSHYMKYFAVC
jgi:hypothetical protein